MLPLIYRVSVILQLFENGYFHFFVVVLVICHEDSLWPLKFFTKLRWEIPLMRSRYSTRLLCVWNLLVEFSRVPTRDIFWTCDFWNIKISVCFGNVERALCCQGSGSGCRYEFNPYVFLGGESEILKPIAVCVFLRDCCGEIRPYSYVFCSSRLVKFLSPFDLTSSFRDRNTGSKSRINKLRLASLPYFVNLLLLMCRWAVNCLGKT